MKREKEGGRECFFDSFKNGSITDINLTQKKMDVIHALRLEIIRRIVQKKDMCTSFLFNLCSSEMKSNKNGYGF